MKIKTNDNYENISMDLISYRDNTFFKNKSFNLSCYKFRKIDQEKNTSWSDLKFKFEFINHDINFNSIGGYSTYSFTKNEFMDLIISTEQAKLDNLCYQNEITIKRRQKDMDFFIKFAISSKYNCNANIIGISSGKSGLIYVGVNALLFNQFIEQWKNLIYNILNYEIAFDQNILLYRNNQLLDYQINQQNNIIDFFNNFNNLQNKSKILLEENNNTNITEIDINENDEVKKNNIKEENIEEFNKLLEENLDTSDFDEKLFDKRIKEINDVSSQNTTSDIIPTIFQKYIIDSKINIDDLCKDIYNNVNTDNESFCFKGIEYFFNLINYNFNLFDGINEDDKKSIYYLTQIQYFKLLTSYKNNNIDAFIPIHVKFEKEIKNLEIIQIIYDIVVFYLYIICISNKLKNRENDINKNKLFLVEIVRIIFEPLFLTYFCNFDSFSKTFEETIISHYYKLKSLNFFNVYENILNEYELQNISEKDFRSTIIDFKRIVSENKRNLKNIHDDAKKIEIVKLPYKNIFDWEHINDICKIESILGNDKFKKEELIEIIHTNNISDKNIVNFIKNNYLVAEKQNEIKKSVSIDLSVVDNTVKEIKQHTALYKYVNKNLKNEVKFKKDLLNFVKEKELNSFSLMELPNNINIYDIPEKILIALNLWKNIDENENMKSYSQFIKMIDNSIETKNDIISLYIAKKEKVLDIKENSQDNEWNDVFK